MIEKPPTNTPSADAPPEPDAPASANGEASQQQTRDVDTDAREYLDQPSKLRKKWIAAQPWPFRHKRAMQERAKVLDYERAQAEHSEHQHEERGRRFSKDHKTERDAKHPAEPWRCNLIVGERGVLPVPANVATILRYHSEWLGVIAYDAFAETAITRKAAPWHSIDAPAEQHVGEWTDDDTARAINWLQRTERLKVSAKIVEQAIAVVAHSNTVHPVRDWLESLKWDGKKRLPSVLHDYFRAEDKPYTSEVGKRWMISGVARVYRPGCQVDCTLVLESRKQGTRKTSGFRAFVPNPRWYADTGITLGDKDSYQNLRGVWIYGLDELDSLKRTEVTRWKTYLSQTQDRYRASYGRRPGTYPRQNVFCGTTNEDEYLADRTGNRRFWPVRIVGDVDVEAIERDRNQLWAEAVARFKRDEPWHVDTAALRDLCEAEQTDRVQTEPWTTLIANWLGDPRCWVRDPQTGIATKQPYTISDKGVLTIEIAMMALNMLESQVTTAHHMRIANVLRDLCYERGPQQRENGARVRRYIKTDELGGGDRGGDKGGDA